MLEFFSNAIKTVIAAITAGIIAIGGIFSYEQAEITPAQTPPAQVVAVQEEQATSSAETVSSTETKAVAEETKKPAAQTYVPPAIPKIEVNIPPAIQVPVVPPQTLSLPPQAEIDPQAMAGILCYYDTTLTNPANGATAKGNRQLLRGSGVVINSKGYILTNRHVVRQPDSTAVINTTDGSRIEVGVSYQLDHCEIGMVPAGTHLPTPQEILAINPLIRIPVLGYTAKPVFISSNTGLSDAEAAVADFAVLQITGLTESGPTFGVTSVPFSFPYAKLLPVDKYDLEGQRVVTYGFPGDVTSGLKESFQTLTMTGSVGNVTKIEVGDIAYANVPLVILTNLEIYHGRSGSPLFWRGHVVGLATFYIEGNRTESGSVASDAIIKALEGTNYLEK